MKTERRLEKELTVTRKKKSLEEMRRKPQVCLVVELKILNCSVIM